MSFSAGLILATIAGASAWKVKIAGAFGDTKCDIAKVGAVWQASFMGSSGNFVLGSFSQQPTSCTAEKLNDELVFSYIVSGSDNGELRVRIPNPCNAAGTPFKQTTCGVTSILAGAGVANATNEAGKTCGVPDGKCGWVNANYCELYSCTGTPTSCSANIMFASFSFDVAVTPNSKACAAGGSTVPFTDETSILAVGTPSGTPGGISSCCAVPNKPTNAPALTNAPAAAETTKVSTTANKDDGTKSSASIVGVVAAAVGAAVLALL